MAVLTDVPIGALSLESFDTVLDPESAKEVREASALAESQFAGRRVWNVNSTARGGGVAELLVTLLAYARGAGVDARWTVIKGDADFFAVTKRIHNRLHGSEGDGGPLGEAEREAYERALAPNAAELRELLDPRDVVILHDPQTAGLVTQLRDSACPIVWRCHVGIDEPNGLAREAWEFLRPYVTPADAYVFSRKGFVWDGLDADRTHIIYPTIDAFAPKNQQLAPGAAEAILSVAGLREDEAADARPCFRRLDGQVEEVRHQAQVEEDRPLRAGDQYVLQVSRWDRLKDPHGVIAGFAEHVAPATRDAHLIYAGPAVDAVSDDPEGAAVLAEAIEQWRALPDGIRERIHLAMLPMDDLEENAAIVNALQSKADVVVQKSIAEGFGLTVAEAMWKGRAVVASRVGGIQDQIEDGVSGVLLDDPRDLAAYGAAVRRLLEHPDEARRMGHAAEERVRGRFLGTQSLLAYLALLERFLR